MDDPGPSLGVLSPMHRMAAGTAIAVAALVLSAHVGISDAIVDGMAGPYPVRVVVRTAGVVPGLAQISVRVLSGSPVSATVQAAPADLGFAAAPKPESMRLSDSAAKLYSAELWLMTRGAYQVRVVMEGREGRGSLTIPVNSLPTRRLAMTRGIGWSLAGLGLLLVAGALTIIRAAVRDAVLPVGAPVDEAAARRGRLALAIGSVVLLAGLAGGWNWWRLEDAAYRRSLERPIAIRSAVGGDTLVLRVVDTLWTPGAISPLIPDHGKMMHLFLVRDGTLQTLAHLHPSFDGERSFTTRLPVLSPGRYRAYGDIVQENGLARTLTTFVDVPENSSSTRAFDSDDSWIESAPLGASGSAGPVTSAISGGGSMSWERAGSLVAGPETSLRIMVRDGRGNPAVLEPYMGMRGHAIVMRDDGEVFVHLHPAGTISMAAQQIMEAREGGSSRDRTDHGSIDEEPGVVRFPFAFPSAGRYRIWVQVRMNDSVRTGVFDTSVEERR